MGIQLLRLATLMVAVSILSFGLMEASPIDPVQAYVGAGESISAEQRDNIAEYWGLNDPPVERFCAWGNAVLHGDLGDSLIYRKPVREVIAERFWASLALMGTAWVLSGVIGFLLGILMALRRGRWLDRLLKGICLTLTSTPTFWLGLLMLMIFAVGLQWFPMGFAVPAGKLASEVTLWDRIYHLILPAATLSMASFANIAMHTRTKLIEVMESDYVLFARARGESTWQIVLDHGLRNIILPAITLQFASFSELFGGSVLAEQVFSYPGLGQAAVTAGLKNDVPLLLGITLFSALFVFVGNLIANLLYGVVNPETREGL
ncbi:MAG: ABC transporter permease [Eubacteriales bacterium]|jgi:peptide/nickel transport system permease protein